LIAAWNIAWRLPFVVLITLFGLLATVLEFLANAMDEWATIIYNFAFPPLTTDEKELD